MDLSSTVQLPMDAEMYIDPLVIVQEEMLESENELEEREKFPEGDESDSCNEKIPAGATAENSASITEGTTEKVNDRHEMLSNDYDATSQPKAELEPDAFARHINHETSVKSSQNNIQRVPAELGLFSDCYDDSRDKSDFTGFANPSVKSAKLGKIRNSRTLMPVKLRSYPEVLGPFTSTFGISGNSIRTGSFERLESFEDLTRGLVFEMYKFVRRHKWKESMMKNSIKCLLPQPVTDALISYKLDRLFGSNGVRSLLSRSLKKKHLLDEFDIMPFVELDDRVPSNYSIPESVPYSSAKIDGGSVPRRKRSIMHSLVPMLGKKILVPMLNQKKIKLEPKSPTKSAIPTNSNMRFVSKIGSNSTKRRRKIKISEEGKKRKRKAINLARKKTLIGLIEPKNYETVNGHANVKNEDLQSELLENMKLELQSQKNLNAKLNVKLMNLNRKSPNSKISTTTIVTNTDNREDEIIQIIEDKYKADLNNLKEEHKETIEVLENKFTEAIDMMESNVKKISLYLKEVHNKTIQTLESKHEEIVVNLEKKHDTICYQLRKN